MKFDRATPISAADASGNLASAALQTAQVMRLSVQAVATSTVTGTLKVQFSNDDVPGTPTTLAPTNWSDITGITVDIAGVGVYSIPIKEMCYRFIRLVYTASSGTGGLVVNTFTIGF